jgi:adenine-specific DNA-methyltransferase
MNKQDLISKIKQLEGISQDERAYLIELVNTKKKYGLVWEDKPEEVEEQLRSMLPVFKEVEEKAIINGDEQPNHILIEGDNLHALTALSYTHDEKIDIIYIDPPYNTGKEYEFKYNDKWVDKNDDFKHSKWIAFMNKRLLIAKKLLSEKGVIFISIDDYEHAQLRMLCDEIFKEKNLLSVLIWDKQHSQQQGIFKKYHEYIYVYAKDAEKIKNIIGGKGIIVAGALKKISQKNPASEFTFPKGTRFDASDNTELFGTFGDSEQVTVIKGKLKAIDGQTTEEVTLSAGWTQKKQMDSFFKGKETYDTKNQKVLSFYFNSTGKIKCEKERVAVTPSSLLPKFGMVSEQTEYLKNILFGEERFSNPKPVEMIKLFINWFKNNNKNTTVLDFFAGSGTTLDAILQINEELKDEAPVQGILVTNNELPENEKKKLIENGILENELYKYGLCNFVTYPRITQILKGYTKPDGEEIKAIKNNLRYYTSGFVPSERNEINRRKLTQESTSLLCIKEDCYKNISKQYEINEKEARIFTNRSGKVMVIIYHSRKQMEMIEKLTEILPTIDSTEKIKLYAFSPEKETIEADFFSVADKIEALPLPDSIYNAYRATFTTLKLDKKQVKPVAEPTT